MRSVFSKYKSKVCLLYSARMILLGADGAKNNNKKKGFLTDFSFATKPVNCSSWSSASLHFQGCKGFTEIIVATPELCMHG